MKLYTSEQILTSEDLYDLQDTFCSSGSPFQYQLTEGEYHWAQFNKNKYSINTWVLDNTDPETKILTFDDSTEMSKALSDDGIPHKAVMLDDATALQKLFFWLNDND